ncbi:alkaline phosphatase family protein [Alteromonas mediterranea]|nr:alkaline phosphatase family protein [Alteromonas mediterranea]
MFMLEAPIIGPIVGHLTSTSLRLMAGCKPTSKDKSNIGRVRIKKSSDDSWEVTKTFRFNRTFYYTGVIELTELEASTKYDYQMAIVSDENEASMPNEADWNSIEVNCFTSRSTASNQPVAFCFGSCLRNSDDGRWGKTLKNVITQNSNKPIDFMLWLGDQIYNDEYMWLTPSNTSKQDFAQRYEAFYNNEYVKEVIRQFSNYMIIDDHEIENSFTDGAKEYEDAGIPWFSRNKERLINGIGAIYSYQLSHGPIFTTERDETQPNVRFVKGQNNHQTPARHYESVKITDKVGLFLTDTRKERTKQKMMSREQEDKLLEFLSDTATKVKLIATSVTFLGDTAKKPKKADNWMKGYKQRARILKYIVNKKIENVVFLSGDIHSHYATQLTVDGLKYKVYQLVSGSLFWPTGFIINKIRWGKEDVNWDYIYGAPSNYGITKPLSDTSKDFFEGNGIGHVLIDDNSFQFTVHNHNEKRVIRVDLPL